ncbi:hypothetical protein Bca4012_073416 [Brassica carinata]
MTGNRVHVDKSTLVTERLETRNGVVYVGLTLRGTETPIQRSTKERKPWLWIQL